MRPTRIRNLLHSTCTVHDFAKFAVCEVCGCCVCLSLFVQWFSNPYGCKRCALGKRRSHPEHPHTRGRGGGATRLGGRLGVLVSAVPMPLPGGRCAVPQARDACRHPAGQRPPRQGAEDPQQGGAARGVSPMTGATTGARCVLMCTHAGEAFGET